MVKRRHSAAYHVENEAIVGPFDGPRSGPRARADYRVGFEAGEVLVGIAARPA